MPNVGRIGSDSIRGFIWQQGRAQTGAGVVEPPAPHFNHCRNTVLDASIASVYRSAGWDEVEPKQICSVCTVGFMFRNPLCLQLLLLLLLLLDTTSDSETTPCYANASTEPVAQWNTTQTQKWQRFTYWRSSHCGWRAAVVSQCCHHL